MNCGVVKSLYIHIPFCLHICSYCDFCKVLYYKPWIKDYLKALKNELESYKINKEQLKTLYIGGGTPTSLDEIELKDLFEILKPYCENVMEYTIEVNPETITKNKINLMKQYGINRVSIGVQTFDESTLLIIKRQHGNQDVFDCIDLFKKANIKNISIDLIYGFKGISKEKIMKDLSTAIQLGVKHISYYSLILEEHTILNLNRDFELDEEDSSDYYSFIKTYLEKNNYQHYEVSNFSLNGFKSMHNQTYWKNELYYGIGVGASGYLNNKRYTNTKSINQYIKGKTIHEETFLNIKEQAFEEIMLGLRLIDGVNKKDFICKYGIDLYHEVEKISFDLEKQGLIMINDEHIRTTKEGMLLLDSVLEKYLEIEQYK